MDFMEMVKRASGEQEDVDCRFLSGPEVEALGGFDHITDLEVGDKLVWKGKEHKYARFPKLEEEIEVCEILVKPLVQCEKGSPVRVEDFLATAFIGGKIVTYSYDSRHFKRV